MLNKVEQLPLHCNIKQCYDCEQTCEDIAPVSKYLSPSSLNQLAT